MEQYAERLRALHRDLTLVLQAVERGLAAASHPENVAPPLPAHDPIEIVPAPTGDPGPAAAPPVTPRGRMPRVEVMPAPSGEHRRDEAEDRRGPRAPETPAPRFSKEPADLDTEADEAVERDERLPRPATRFPARPSGVPDGPQREPEWVDRSDDGFTAPTFPPAHGQRLRISPLVATALVVAWLTIVGLLIALLVS